MGYYQPILKYWDSPRSKNYGSTLTYKDPGKKEEERLWNALRLLCTFINPQAAEKVFKEPEVSVNVGFEDNLKALDPNFDISKYKDVLDALDKK